MCRVFEKKNYFSAEPRCTDAEVRLVQGTSHSIGIVQLCHNDDWGSVCAHGWDNNDATVVCRQLGFSPKGIYIHNAATILSVLASITVP